MSSAPRVAVTSLGCKVNFAEMAELAGVLAAAGCDVVPDAEPADVRVLNSCTVTMQADATTRQRLRRLRRDDPHAYLVLTGCSVDTNLSVYGNATTHSERDLVDAVFANADKSKIAEHVLDRLSNRVDHQPRRTPGLRSRAFLKVQDGCNHRCTYCIVWRARGLSVSRSMTSVFESAERCIDAGYRELVVCGVDLGSYGREAGSDLATLVSEMLERYGDRARLRLSSINANDVTPALIELNSHPRLCSHWHMPLQSGSDSVLRTMHRGYRRKQYLRVVDALRDRDPATEFTTDIMVGFPGESDTDHDASLALIDEVGFHSCHVFRWSPRPETPASDYAGRVDDRVARRRSAELRRAASRAGDSSRRRATGRIHEVVWESAHSAEARGLSATYHEIVVHDHRPEPGTLALVRAEAIEGDHLRGTLVAG